MYDQNEKSGVTYEKPKQRHTVLFDGIPLYEIGDFISKDQAREYHKNYLEKPHFETGRKDKPVYKASLFGKGNILKLLLQPDCHGMRIYYGKDEHGRPAPMIVGVYRNGNDMTDHTLIANMSKPCPDQCDGDDPNDPGEGTFNG